MRFAFVHAEKAEHSVGILCRVLAVSRSGYYAWVKRGPSQREQEDGRLRVAVRAAYKRARGTYGAPRIRAELAAEGVDVSQKRVARIMREEGLEGRSGRKGIRTTRSTPGTNVVDLVKRDFTAAAPNEVWVADTTYVRCATGFVFLLVVLDLFSRRVVGWHVAHRLDAALAVEALTKALQRREHAWGLIFHSDRGSEFTASAFTDKLKRIDARQSHSGVGDCFDNAVAESFFGTFKGDVGITDGRVLDDLEHARAVAGSYIEAFYNRERRHSTIGYLSPVDFERKMREQRRAA